MRGSGLVLLHNEMLLEILDGWVKTLKEEVFVQILPLLRRTFSTLHQPERRQIGNKIKNGIAAGGIQTAETEFGEIDETRADMVLPLLAQLLGAGTN